jgi:hypothetical protein
VLSMAHVSFSVAGDGSKSCLMHEGSHTKCMSDPLQCADRLSVSNHVGLSGNHCIS